MSSSIYYKNETLLACSSSRLEILAEKMLFFAQQQCIDPQSNLIGLIHDCMNNHGGFINWQLDSKIEVFKFAELAELAINALNNEGYFEYSNYEENGKILNGLLTSYRGVVERLKEIAAHEWKDENLFIGRANRLHYLDNMLLKFAQEKHLDSNSNLMKFLQSLIDEKTKDIEIYSKEELNQFIELAELSLQASINSGRFKEYDIIKNNKTFNYLQHNYLTFIQRLKEVANDWDNTISDDWKRGKIRTIEKKAIPKNEPVADLSLILKSTITDFITLIFHIFLLVTIILGILWLLTLMVKCIPLIQTWIKLIIY